eukprot:COSAG01_NODE_26696_length_705_cov_35.798680_1_plen_117_part_10
MAELPDVKAVLNTVYTPKLTLNKFVVKSLEKYPKLQLKDIQAFWKEANFKEKKQTSKEKPEKSAKAEIGSLDKEQRNALTDIMFSVVLSGLATLPPPARCCSTSRSSSQDGERSSSR